MQGTGAGRHEFFLPAPVTRRFRDADMPLARETHFIAGFGDGFQNLGIKVQIGKFGHVRPFKASRRSGLAGYGTQYPGAPRRLGSDEPLFGSDEPLFP